MSLKTLLALLADGECHSGEEIGQVLGVSRTAIWKQLKKCDALGISVESIKGKGYQIPAGIDFLDRQIIERTLTAQTRERIAGLDIFFDIGSTNLHAMNKAVELKDQSRGYVCAAEMQTQGRGRRGKPWVSPFACNLYFSIVWQFDNGIMAMEGLSLAIGVALVNALQACGLADVQLKWPNDVLYQDKKLAGILLEIAGDASGECQVVIGVGLNVNMPEEEAKLIDQSWIDVSSIAGKAISRNVLFAGVLDGIFDVLVSYEQLGFAHYVSRWTELDAFRGREVAVTLGESVITGTAAGVDASGALRLVTGAGERTFSGGEVSLRAVKS